MLGIQTEHPSPPSMSPSDARIALACLELSSLGEDDTPAVIAALARRAHTPYGTPSTICVYPELLLATRMSLMREGIPQVRVATVVNFPDGGSDADRAERETRRAVGAGADEIDLLFPAQLFRVGERSAAQALVARVKARCGKAGLKVILDGAAFGELPTLRAAAETAIAGGADFLKIPVRSATDAFRCVGAAIAGAARPVGMAVFGDIPSLAQASACIALAAGIFGRERVVPARFRIASNALLDALSTALAAEPVDDD
jgi:deoxyribose-phosphate aldolase